MAQKVIPYSTRDYQTLLGILNADPLLKELPQYVKNALCAPFDVLNNVANVSANSVIGPTIFSRPEAVDVYSLLDYQARWKSTSSLTAELQLNTPGPYVIPKAQVKARSLATEILDPLQWESREDVSVANLATSATCIMYQQTTQPQTIIGESDGTDWQEFDIPFSDVIKEVITLFDGVNTYLLTDSFVGKTSTDSVFRIYYRTDGTCFVRFGGSGRDGVQRGRIPSNGSDIYVNCATGGGAKTIIEPNQFELYLGSDARVDSIDNTTESSGGSNEETIEAIKRNAPLEFRTVENFWFNDSNAKAIARRADSAVFDIQLVPNPLAQIKDVNVYILPYGGGAASGGTITAVQTALIKASELEQCIVNAASATYVNVAIAGTIRLLPGYTFGDAGVTDVKPYVYLAGALATDETGAQILEAYSSNQDVQELLDLINTILGVRIGYTFTLSDDITQIKRIVKETRATRFQTNLDESDVVAPMRLLPSGVDSIDLTGTWPVVVDDPGEISHLQSIALTLV